MKKINRARTLSTCRQGIFLPYSTQLQGTSLAGRFGPRTSRRMIPRLRRTFLASGMGVRQPRNGPLLSRIGLLRFLRGLEGGPFFARMTKTPRSFDPHVPRRSPPASNTAFGLEHLLGLAFTLVRKVLQCDMAEKVVFGGTQKWRPFLAELEDGAWEKFNNSK